MENPCFLVINLDEELNVNEFYSYLNKNYSNYSLNLVCPTGYNELTLDNVNQLFFDKNANVDEVINTIAPTLDGDCLVVVKKINNDNYEMIKDLTDKTDDSNKIVLTKNKDNVVKKWFLITINFIFNLLMGYKLFEGNISIISFGKNALNVIKQCNSPSLLVKINKWIGMDINYIEAEVPKINYKISIKKIISTVIFSVIFITLILLKILVFRNISAASNLLLISGILISFIIMIMLIILMIAENEIGNITIKKAKQTNK